MGHVHRNHASTGFGAGAVGGWGGGGGGGGKWGGGGGGGGGGCGVFFAEGDGMGSPEVGGAANKDVAT